jgi:hypothetical protein
MRLCAPGNPATQYIVKSANYLEEIYSVLSQPQCRSLNFTLVTPFSSFTKEDVGPQQAAGAPPPEHQSLIKLPAFWTEDSVSWFWLTEGQFTLWNMADLITRYYHVLSSLSQDAVRLVGHVLHEETGPDFYANLRTFLLVSHSFSNYQKMERIMKLPPLGNCKPSVMLVEMLEYCPVGESTTTVFAYLFLQQLPREICVLLSKDDPADMRAIADKADRIIAKIHVPQGHNACTAVASDDDLESGELLAASYGARQKKFKLLSAQWPQQQQKSHCQWQDAPPRHQG